MTAPAAVAGSLHPPGVGNGVRVAWPLFGRDEELSLLAEAVGASSGSVLIAGEAGVGKTALAEELLRLAEAEGARTAQVFGGSSSSAIAFGAFAQLLDPVEGSTSAAAVQSALKTVTSMAEGSGLLLHVDDCHQLDDASATLVHHLVREGSVWLVCTMRTGEGVPEPIESLWKDDLVTRIDLQPLAFGDVQALLEAVCADAPVDPAAASRLWSVSQGNPLYLRELVTGALATGRLCETEGFWRLDPDPELPVRLVELIERRLTTLSQEERDVLELLAVAEALDVDVLLETCSTDALDELQTAGWITVREGRMARLAHPLYGEAAEALMPVGRARRVRRRAALLLADDAPEHGRDPVRSALLLLDAGDVLDPELLAEAAYSASIRPDHAVTVRRARAALEAGARPPQPRRRREARRQQGRYEEAEAELLRVDAVELRTDQERAQYADTRAENLFRGLGRAEEARHILDACERTLTDPVWTREVHAFRATFDLLSARLEETIERTLPILDEPVGRATVPAAMCAATALALAGRASEGIEISDRGLAVRGELGDMPSIEDPDTLVVTRVLGLFEGGRLDEAEDLASLGYRWSLGVGNVYGQAWMAMMLGRVYLVTGRQRQAEERFAEAAMACADVNDPAPRRWSLAGAARAAAQRGCSEDARRFMEQADAVDPGAVRLIEPEVGRARAWVVAASGEHSAARELIYEAACEARTTGQLSLECAALHDAVRLDAAPEVAERLGELACQVEGPLHQARARHAAALTAGDAGGVEATADAFEEAGALLFAAEAAAQAGSLYAKGGQRRAATAVRHKAHVLAERCEDAATPALVATGEAVSLSAREREVATLAANGATSKEIAERLVISVRTVNNHLQRIYQKLGTSSRAELTARLGARD